MAKFRFYYSVMNAGKSVHLLQVNHNYRYQGRDTILLTHSTDNRFGTGLIKSRMGIEAEALSVSEDFDIFEHVKSMVEDKTKDIACVLVDESQFFSRKHVEQLSDVVDFLNVPVMCYGLRTNSNGTLFEGSKALFELADEVEEISQVCFCGSKARMVLKFTQDGRVTKNGKIIDVGAEEKYISVCRYHWKTITHIDEIKKGS
ncbi:thymidine kinase [Candidatus Ulvibacter alkanivorans]|jgi:thymidine kinase|uniref:thymidine kinase n=1 Tax=Candidatus Ulvibacter alkanivorans TaxID=2267620 RepID=UPI0021D07A33|nr:thymidine kinase [Candidatus Ulvibacter alkanivorans]